MLVYQRVNPQWLVHSQYIYIPPIGDVEPDPILRIQGKASHASTNVNFYMGPTM